MKKRLLMAVMASVLGTYSSVYGSQEVHAELSSPDLMSFVRKPIAEWPRVKTISGEKVLGEYKKAAELKSEEVAEMFMETCCDLGFKQSEMIPLVYQGAAGSDPKFVATTNPKAICDGAKISEDKSTVVFTAGDGNKFSFPYGAQLVCFRAKPCDMSSYLAGQIKGYFLECSKNAVGLEIMRVAIAKFKANGQDKIVFVPVDGDGSDFATATSECLGDWLEKKDKSGEVSREQELGKFITFPRDMSSYSEPCVKMGKKNNLIIANREASIKALLIHEVLHHILPQNDNSLRVIEKMSEKKANTAITISFKESTLKKPAFKVGGMCQLLFSNGKELEDIFGITSEGLNLLSHNMFLLFDNDVDDYIRLGHNVEAFKFGYSGRAALLLDSTKCAENFLQRSDLERLYLFYFDFAAQKKLAYQKATGRPFGPEAAEWLARNAFSQLSESELPKSESELPKKKNKKKKPQKKTGVDSSASLSSSSTGSNPATDAKQDDTEQLEEGLRKLTMGEKESSISIAELTTPSTGARSSEGGAK